MSNTPHGGGPDPAGAVRPLPPRPNLEFEHKQAKKLLRQLRKGDAEAVARAHAKHGANTGKSPVQFQLSDAQFTIAREYGFTSWPKLVEYFELLARHEASGQRVLGPGERHETLSRTATRQFAARLPWTAAAITRFVPRFYGRTADDVFASEITEDEWRLVSARMNRFPSWKAMVETVQPSRDRWRDDPPMRQAGRAIRNRDLGALKTLIAKHPELASVSNQAEPWASSILYSVINSEMRGLGKQTTEDSEWLASTDLDLKPALTWLLLGFMRMETRTIQWALDHGADPEWMPPNGISVLEHALYRYWNGDAVDLIVARVKPREALWISAGVGDVAAVRRYFDKSGKLTDTARAVRPDFTAMGPLPGPPTFGDSDIDILWEAYLIAAWNERFEVMDALLGQGLPIDYSPWGQPLIGWAIFELRPALVEFLVTRGTTIDTQIRETAEAQFFHRPSDTSRRILELCGGRDLDVVRREYEERRDSRVMQTIPEVEKAFDFAKLDAQHLGLKAVSPENLFVGLMREDGMPVYPVAAAGTDLLRLRAALGDRFETSGDPPADMIADEECMAILLAARREAEQRKHGHHTTVHMFYALMREPPQSVVDLIRSAGGEPAKVIAETERIFAGMR